MRRRTELGLLIYACGIAIALYLIASFASSPASQHTSDTFSGSSWGWPWWPMSAIAGLRPNRAPSFSPWSSSSTASGTWSSRRWDPGNAEVQAGWTALGIVFYLVTLFVIRRSRDLERYRYVILLIGGLLLVAPLLPVFGKDVNGARLWVGVGFMIVQPVEGAKLLLCIYFASYFAANKEILSIPTARIGRRLYLDPRPLLPILLAWIVSIAIIGAENDIAFAFLLFALFVGLLWITTGRTVYLLGGLGLFALGAVVASRLFSQVHERVVIWLHASQYPSGAGYQLVQSWYSLAAGGVGGTGLGRGTSAEYLHGYVISDLVFTGISEELGLVGAVCTIVTFVSDRRLRSPDRPNCSF